MKLFILDNEISAEFKEAPKKYKFTYEWTPPNIHQQNAVECAICTSKNHFMAGLTMCHLQFPIAEWDRTMEQANLTLNLLCTSR
eukprot:1324132-Ditylum_brightwellii.AAC.1